MHYNVIEGFIIERRLFMEAVTRPIPANGTSMFRRTKRSLRKTERLNMYDVYDKDGYEFLADPHKALQYFYAIALAHAMTQGACNGF